MNTKLKGIAPIKYYLIAVVLVMLSPFLLMWGGTIYGLQCATYMVRNVDETFSVGMSIAQAESNLKNWGVTHVYDSDIGKCIEDGNIPLLAHQSEVHSCMFTQIETSKGLCKGQTILTDLYFNELGILVKWRLRDGNAYL